MEAEFFYRRVDAEGGSAEGGRRSPAGRGAISWRKASPSHTEKAAAAMIWLLRKFLEWRGAALDVVPISVMKLTQEALPLVAAFEPRDASGEYKRHQVYARLLKHYPDAKRADVAWAIERAVRRR